MRQPAHACGVGLDTFATLVAVGSPREVDIAAAEVVETSIVVHEGECYYTSERITFLRYKSSPPPRYSFSLQPPFLTTPTWQAENGRQFAQTRCQLVCRFEVCNFLSLLSHHPSSPIAARVHYALSSAPCTPPLLSASRHSCPLWWSRRWVGSLSREHICHPASILLRACRAEGRGHMIYTHAY